MSNIVNKVLFNKNNSEVLKNVTKRHLNQTASLPQESIKVKEVRIPVPWGHVAGKLWGPEHVRPVLALHGWQDNAGSFDTLAPLLVAAETSGGNDGVISVLALDWPGHGLSSRIPDGLMYSTQELVPLLYRIQRHYGWQKLSLLGHSMGSIASFMYCAAMGPDYVDMAIGVDALKPQVSEADKFPAMIRKKCEDFLKIDERNRKSEQEPPCYTIEEMIDRWHNGTDKSVAKDKCQYLLERSIQESHHNPGKYYFTRDNRLKTIIFSGIGQDISLALARNITMPFMAVKAKRSPYYEDKKYHYEAVDAMRTVNKDFEYLEVDGTHHVHLNEPEKLADVFVKFIRRHKKD